MRASAPAVAHDATPTSLMRPMKQSLPCSDAAAMVISIGTCQRPEATMGDKSPKNKQRDQKQKDNVKQQQAAAAKTKQSSNAVGVKDKK